MSAKYSSYSRIVDTPGIVRLLLWISVVGSISIAIAYWISNGWQETSFSLFLMALISGALFILLRFGLTQVAGFLLYIQVSLIMTFNLSVGHAIYDEGILVFPLLIVFSGLIFGKRTAVLVTAISVSEIGFLHILGEAGHVLPFEGAIPLLMEDTITTSLILLATGFLVWAVVDIIEKSVEQINQSEIEIEGAYDQTLIAWAKALELREREDPGHSDRVTSLTSLFAEDIGLSPDEVKTIWRGALLHDIGKMGIPEKILLKSDSLDSEEKLINRTHPTLGKLVFEDVDYLHGALEVVMYHHERYDGQGYPDQLLGEEIPYQAQLFSIVDCWDVLRTDRPCQPSLTDEETLAYIQGQSGKKFSPGLVEKFMALVEKFGLKET